MNTRILLPLFCLCLFASANVMAEPHGRSDRHWRPAQASRHAPPPRHVYVRPQVRSTSTRIVIAPSYPIVTYSPPPVVYYSPPPVVYSPPPPVVYSPPPVYSAPSPQYYYEESRVEESNRDAARVLGTIVGGVIGHQAGRGSGRTAATIGGAVVGGIIADQLAR
jgi:hypothetical protein